MLDNRKNYCLPIHAVGFVLFMIFLLTLIYNINYGWSYYFFDVVTKLVSGIGTIIAGIFIYMKWSDEKTRKLYERRLEEVYAPLVGILIKEKTYRDFDEMVCFDFFDENECGYALYIKKTRKDILTFFENNTMKWGLARPELLSLYTQYKILLENYLAGHEKGEHWFLNYNGRAYSKNEDLDNKCSNVEDLLINEIIDGYNECIKKLSMDKTRIGLNFKKYKECE